MTGTLITDRRTATATYKILRRLGKGGMAEVFLAEQEGIAGVRRLAVVKKILPQFSEIETVAEMLLDEARIAIQLSHPNIVQIYELGKDEGQYFIAMEFVDGCDLATLARVERHRQSRIPMRLTLRVVSEAAMGLDFAHRQRGLDGRPLNVVHRDVSPHNIMCSREGAVKVTDFGIAKAVGKVQVTEVGVVKGKVQYMSPEQYTGGEVDHRADIFSLGVVLYQLTTGRLPRAGKSGNLSMRRVIEGRIPRPSEIRQDYPEALEEIVMRALGHNPEDRYPDAASLRDDLLDFARQHDLLAFPKELGDYVTQTVPADSAAQEGDLAGDEDAGKRRLVGRRSRLEGSPPAASEPESGRVGTEKVNRLGPAAAVARELAAERLAIEPVPPTARPQTVDSASIVASESVAEGRSEASRALLSNEELTPVRRSRAAAEIVSAIEVLEQDASAAALEPPEDLELPGDNGGDSVAASAAGVFSSPGAIGSAGAVRAQLKGPGLANLARRTGRERELDAESPESRAGEALPIAQDPWPPGALGDGLDDPSRALTQVANRRAAPRAEPSVEVDDSIVIDQEPPLHPGPASAPTDAAAVARPASRRSRGRSQDWVWGSGERAGTERVVATERSLSPRKGATSTNNAIVIVLGLAVVVGIAGLVFLAARRPGVSHVQRSVDNTVTSGILDVLANPAEAHVMIDGAQRCASTPCRIDALPLGTLLVTVKAPGYRLWNQRVVLSADRARVVINPALVRDMVPASPSSAPVQPKASGHPAPAKAPSRAAAAKKPRTQTGGRSPRPRSAGARPAAAVRGGKGKGKGVITVTPVDAKIALISVDVRPAWAEVWVDGKLVGPTPLQRAIPPGRHTIELKNEKYGFRRIYRLRFKNGQNVKIRDTITPPKPSKPS